MQIQFNTGQKITASEQFKAPLIELISKKLNRFSSHITRIEVYISDEDGEKKGLMDKRCVMEARVENHQPVTVTNQADSHKKAVDGAIEKMKASLDTIIGRLRE